MRGIGDFFRIERSVDLSCAGSSETARGVGVLRLSVGVGVIATGATAAAATVGVVVVLATVVVVDRMLVVDAVPETNWYFFSCFFKKRSR